MTYSNIMTDYAVRMRNKWNDGATVDISEEMMQLTLGIICKSVLNYDVESEAQEVGKALTTVRKYSKRLQSPICHVLDKIPILPAPRRAREARKELDSLVYGLISDRRQQEESDNDKRYDDDLLSRLMQAQESNIADHVSHNGVPSTSTPNEKMSDKQVRDEVMTIFIAGHETTLNALTWTFYLLSQYPDVERKLHEEFNPNRWTDDFKAHLPRFSYFPFGGGIRGCIGESFAWMEGILIIATIAQEWSMRLVPSQHIKLDPAITLRSRYGMKMELLQRKK
jgi:cytochrome P450